MAVEIQAPSFEMIPLDKIVSRLPVRRLSPYGLKIIRESMKKAGFLENLPAVVAALEDGTFMLIEGNHRYTVAPEFGITSIPCLVKYGLSEDEMYKLAIQSNEASGAVVPMTLVSYAEFVWERSKEGKNLFDIGVMLGWTEAKTKQYSALSAINEDAWGVIVTTFEKEPSTGSEDTVTKEVTGVTFTEFLLRNILDLLPEQQLELVQSLAHPNKDQRITKGKFTELAKAYQGRNEMKGHGCAQLGDLGEAYLVQNQATFLGMSR